MGRQCAGHRVQGSSENWVSQGQWQLVSLGSGHQPQTPGCQQGSEEGGETPCRWSVNSVILLTWSGHDATPVVISVHTSLSASSGKASFG